MPSTHSKPASEAAAVEQLLRQDGFVDELFDPVKEGTDPADRRI